MASSPLKRKIRKLLRNPRLLLFSATLVVLFTALLLGNKGIWRHLQLRHEISGLQETEAEMKAEVQDITAQIDLLRKEDPLTIERIARERYNLKRTGEVIYRESD